MDILVELPRNEWPALRDLYKTVWPRGAAAYCALDTQIANAGLSQSVSFKVYCPGGDMTNGMIAVVDAFGDYQLLIYPIKDTAKIEEALQKTNIIDWDRYIILPFAGVELIDMMKGVQEELKITMKLDDSKAFKHLLDSKKPLYDLSICPPDTYVAPLKPEHVSLVDKTWVYHGETTHIFFEVLMKNAMTYVLYSSKEDTPMAWITIGVLGALTHLYTLDPYRRLGYAEFLTKYAANELMKRGRSVIAYTVEGNVGPQRMFEKLGFEMTGYDRWVFIERKKGIINNA